MNGMSTSLQGVGYQQDYVPHVSYTVERNHHNIPSSLWMSPASTASPSPQFTHQPYNSLSHLTMPSQLHPLPESVVATASTSSTQSILTSTSSTSTAPTSASSPKTTRQYSSILSDDLFSSRSPSILDPTASSFPSPVASGSPDLKSTGLSGDDTDPETLAREDPYMTQVWKMYAKAKAGLPHAHRMENLSWRMGGLVLKKKKGDEEKTFGDERKASLGSHSADQPDASSARPPGSINGVGGEGGSSSSSGGRGRTIDKGKARVKVEGFDGVSADGEEDNE